jgi:hypothetical protein
MMHPWRRALTTSSAATSFASKIPTATEPTGDGVHDLRGLAERLVLLQPFGTDGDNDTFEMRMYGWAQDSTGALWFPYIIADVAVVLGNISGAAIATNTFIADTITLNEGIAAGPFHGLLSTAEDTPSSAIFHTLGAQKIEFDFDRAGGQEGATCNCYWKLLNY